MYMSVIQVSKKRLTSGSSSVHTTTDSGVGVDMWGGNNIMTTDDRTRAYVYNHIRMTNAMPERDRDARAAAIALISNSPHPETLNPRIPQQTVHHQERQRRFNSHSHSHGHSHGHGQYVRNYPGAYSDSDTSSCATMSSTSELFIPRRIPPAHSVYSDDSYHRPHYPLQK